MAQNPLASQLSPSKKVAVKCISIAIVDDEPDLRSALSKTLSLAGYDKLELFKDGESFCETARKTRFDVVLMDYQMPGMNGIEAAKVARECSPDTKIILVTGYASVREEALAEGFHYMQKPFSVRALTKILRSMSAD